MILKELLALCDDGNAMITIIREDGMELENGKASLLYTSSHYPFYDVISFGVHRGELHICISSEPNWDEKRKFYPASYGITKISLEEDQMGGRSMVYEEVSSKRDIQPICKALGDIVIEDLDLSVRAYNCFIRAGIRTVSDLYNKLNEGLSSCMRIRHLGRKGLVEMLAVARAVGYTFDSEMELFLSESTISGVIERETRISQINLLDITMEKPDYSSYTDGTKGFTLFANIHNKSNQVMLVELKEFLLFCNGRQWVPSSNLTGYSFSAEHIMPMSSKTAAKIWSGEPWVNTKLIDGDYVTIVIELNSVSHAFKFVLRDGLFIINDYCIF